MPIERRGADDGVNAALEELRSQIDQRVRAEQLCDQLTRLPNDTALSAAIDGLMERREQFWLAFFEIDRFKWINDQFGYQNADILLQRVAEVLDGATHYFGEPVSAFRPHGDEFYLLGSWHDDAAADQLDTTLALVQSNVSALQVPTARGILQCTVSVGWLDSMSLEADLALRQGVLTRREIFGALEVTVGEAKWQRDCVVRFSSDLRKDGAIALRSDCSACRCKFQVSVKRSGLADAAQWCCPNCGTRQERPPLPSLDQPSSPVTI